MGRRVSLDPLMQRKSPARRQKKLRCSRSLHNWVVFLKIRIREDLFYVNQENWDQNTPSNSPKAPGTKSKFGKERVHREVLSKSVRLMSVVLARAEDSRERSHEETLHQERCARKAAWDLAKNIYKLENSDNTTFNILGEVKDHVNTYRFKKTRGSRIRSRFRSISAHDEQKRIEIRELTALRSMVDTRSRVRLVEPKTSSRRGARSAEAGERCDTPSAWIRCVAHLRGSREAFFPFFLRSQIPCDALGLPMETILDSSWRHTSEGLSWRVATCWWWIHLCYHLRCWFVEAPKGRKQRLCHQVRATFGCPVGELDAPTWKLSGTKGASAFLENRRNHCLSQHVYAFLFTQSSSVPFLYV